jgi:hypothetical protein
MANTGWILQNYRCSFDNFTIGENDFDAIIPPGEYRRKVGFLDIVLEAETTDFPPPLSTLPIGYEGDSSEIGPVYFGTTQFVVTSLPDWVDDNPLAILNDKVIEYDRGRANHYNVVESWTLRSYEIYEKTLTVSGAETWTLYAPAE